MGRKKAKPLKHPTYCWGCHVIIFRTTLNDKDTNTCLKCRTMEIKSVRYEMRIPKSTPQNRIMEPLRDKIESSSYDYFEYRWLANFVIHVRTFKIMPIDVKLLILSYLISPHLVEKLKIFCKSENSKFEKFV